MSPTHHRHLCLLPFMLAFWFFFPHPSSATTALMCVCLCPFSSALCFLIRRLSGQSEVHDTEYTGLSPGDRTDSRSEEKLGGGRDRLHFFRSIFAFPVDRLYHKTPPNTYHWTLVTIGPSTKGNRSWSDLLFFLLIISHQLAQPFLKKLYSSVLTVLTSTTGNTSQHCLHSFQCYCYLRYLRYQYAILV